MFQWLIHKLVAICYIKDVTCRKDHLTKLNESFFSFRTDSQDSSHGYESPLAGIGLGFILDHIRPTHTSCQIIRKNSKTLPTKSISRSLWRSLMLRMSLLESLSISSRGIGASCGRKWSVQNTSKWNEWNCMCCGPNPLSSLVNYLLNSI